MSEKLLKISLTIKVNKGREWKYTYPLMITPQWRRKQIERRGVVDLSDILTSKKKVFGRLCIKFQQQKNPPPAPHPVPTTMHQYGLIIISSKF